MLLVSGRRRRRVRRRRSLLGEFRLGLFLVQPPGEPLPGAVSCSLFARAWIMSVTVLWDFAGVA
jgi:hypothetical protein